MVPMIWIERKKRAFQAAAAVSAILMSALVLWVNVRPGRVSHPTRFQAGVFALPWLAWFIAFAPLAYLSWTKRVRSAPVRLLIAGFLSLYLMVVFAGFGFFYGRYVFRIF